MTLEQIKQQLIDVYKVPQNQIDRIDSVAVELDSTTMYDKRQIAYSLATIMVRLAKAGQDTVEAFVDIRFILDIATTTNNDWEVAADYYYKVDKTRVSDSFSYSGQLAVESVKVVTDEIKKEYVKVGKKFPNLLLMLKKKWR